MEKALLAQQIHLSDASAFHTYLPSEGSLGLASHFEDIGVAPLPSTLAF